MRPTWSELASLAQKTVHSILLCSVVYSLLTKDNPFIERICK